MASEFDLMMKLTDRPTGAGRNGIHICAQLRVDGMQLRDHRVGWAADTMEKAAQDIEFLEKEVVRLLSGNFTEEEFQNLCHNFSAEDRERFKKGCEDYQKKLFGSET